jgi:hypothetical protein
VTAVEDSVKKIAGHFRQMAELAAIKGGASEWDKFEASVEKAIQEIVSVAQRAA